MKDEFKPLVYKGTTHEKYLINREGVIITYDGKRLKEYYNNGNYRTVSISDEYTKGFIAVHRSVAETFIYNSKPEVFNVVNHKDGNKENCNDWNLEWTTHSENLKHALVHGLRIPAHGENHNRALYTDKEVHEICRMISDGKSYDYILTSMGKIPNKINKNALKGIRAKRNWKHISSLYEFPETQNRGKMKNDKVHKICNLLARGVRSIESILKQVNLVDDRLYRESIRKIYKCEVYKNICKLYYWDNTGEDLY